MQSRSRRGAAAVSENKLPEPGANRRVKSHQTGRMGKPKRIKRRLGDASRRTLVRMKSRRKKVLIDKC